MDSRINPFGQATHHWPASLCQRPAQLFSHLQAMAGSRTRADHRDGSPLRQRRQEAIVSFAIKSHGRSLQPIQAGRPSGVHRQQHINRHRQIWGKSQAGPVAIKRRHHRIGPAQRSLQARSRPVPQLVQARSCSIETARRAAIRAAPSPGHPLQSNHQQRITALIVYMNYCTDRSFCGPRRSACRLATYRRTVFSTVIFSLR